MHVAHLCFQTLEQTFNNGINKTVLHCCETPEILLKGDGLAEENRTITGSPWHASFAMM